LADKESLRDTYEELRAFAISPVKIPTQPMGLDLWLKRGFLSWIIITLRKDPPQISRDPIRGENPGLPAAQVKNTSVPPGLVISLSNILMEWSDKNVRQQDQEGTFDPQSVPLHTPVYPSPSS